MTEDQKIKLTIVAIAEVLEVDLPPKRLALYFSALKDLGADKLQCAVAAVLADPDLRPGTMILPGKIRELALGSIYDEADAMLPVILDAADNYSKRAELLEFNRLAYDLGKEYGWDTLRNRSEGAMPTIIAQLRSLARSKLSARRRAKAERAMLPSFAEPNAIAGVLESVASTPEDSGAS